MSPASLMMVMLKPLDASQFAHMVTIPMKNTERTRNRIPELDEMRLIAASLAAVLAEEVVAGGWRRGWRRL